MDRRKFVATLTATVPLMATRVALAEAGNSNPRVADKINHAEPMKDRYRLTLKRVLEDSGPAYTPAFLLEDIRASGGRRFTNFSGDVSGRWVGALASASRSYGDSMPLLDSVVAQIIALQHEDGYFGKIFRYENQDDNDMALLWGNGRLLIGLLEYYALRPDPKVLASARRLGDFLVKIGPDFNTQKKADEFGAAHYGSSYICWTQQTEGLAALYGATKDARYRDLAMEITKRIERRPSDHVHGYLCSIRGAVDLYEFTKDPALLNKATAEWKSVMTSGDVLNTGGVPERWSPLAKRTEGCAECDWLRLNLSLHRVTGEPVYLEAAEKVLFNEFAMNQFSTGDFGHAVLYQNGTTETVNTRAWWCCTLHGLRAFADVHDNTFQAKGDEIVYQLPIDGAIRTAEFAARATSNLATDGTVEIRVRKAAAHALTIRKPIWASAVSIRVNGRTLPGPRVESLKAGDVISLQYAMELREEKAGESTVLSTRRSFFYGPWLLGVSLDGNPGFFCEPQHLAANKIVRGTAEAFETKTTSAFDVPAAARSIAFVPAEFPDQPSRASLRAVAEQTAILPTAWETTFKVVSEPGPAVSS